MASVLYWPGSGARVYFHHIGVCYRLLAACGSSAASAQVLCTVSCPKAFLFADDPTLSTIHQRTNRNRATIAQVSYLVDGSAKLMCFVLLRHSRMPGELWGSKQFNFRLLWRTRRFRYAVKNVRRCIFVVFMKSKIYLRRNIAFSHLSCDRKA